jgi:predicted short-subunit dehydrogenase-like oxidoreductase (DUF2520 family)
LAAAFAEAGHRSQPVPGRGLPGRLPEAEIAFLAVPDPEVARVATAVAKGLPKASAVVHVSGSLPLAALEQARAAGHETGSFHPLQSFPFERPPSAFVGSLIAVDSASPRLAAQLDQLAREIGGRPRRVPDEQRALYHVAAVLASNLVLGLVGTASTVLESAGWSPKDALDALLPLLDGVVDNLAAKGLEGALIGPIRRGDSATVRRHLAELESHGLEEPARVYRILAVATLELALAAGLDPVSGEQIRVALTGPPAATGGDAR